MSDNGSLSLLYPKASREEKPIEARPCDNLKVEPILGNKAIATDYFMWGGVVQRGWVGILGAEGFP